MKLITIFSFIFLSQAHATTLYKIEGKEVPFFVNDNLAVVVSKNCKELEQNKLCPFLSYLEQLNVDAKNNTGEMPNFGSLACTEKLKGKVYLGFDKNKNEITFCKIDDYFIDLGTLRYYVEKNKGLISNSRHRKSK